jgi:hypothetical protein
MKFKKFFSNELKVEDIAGNRPQAPSDYEAFMKTWVHGLHALKDRSCICKYLLVAIANVITKGHSNASSETVEADFKTIIHSYPTEQILDTTNKVLDWYKHSDTDVVITIYVRNTVNRLLQENSKSLSFKEELALVADEYRANLDIMNINENINKIKAKLKEVAIYRKFSIYLYKVKPKSSLALGGCDLKSISLFVPTGVTLAEYTILMTDALIEELGFSRSDISWQTDSTNTYDSCCLKVTW